MPTLDLRLDRFIRGTVARRFLAGRTREEGKVRSRFSKGPVEGSDTQPLRSSPGRRNREPLAPFVAAAGTDTFFEQGWNERRRRERESEIARARRTDRG